MSAFIKLTLIKPVELLAAFANLLFLFACLFLLYLHHTLPPSVPLWYTKTTGGERLASPKSLWLLPALVTGFFLANNFAAKLIEENNPVIAKILVWSSTFVSLVVFFSLYKILLSVV